MQMTQELFLEFGRLGLVFVHLIACCLAIGLVLKSDVAMIRNLLDPERAPDANHMREMNQLQSIVVSALAVLWVSGSAIVALDALSQDGLAYFDNPKLQAKILIVVLLTINGALLHSAVLPALQRFGSLLRMPFGRAMLATFAGVVSGVSWFYAAMLGIGRPLAWKYSLAELMAAYPLLIAGGFLSMLAVVAWAKWDRDPAFRTAQPA